MSQESKHRLRRRDSRTLRVPRGWWERDQRGKKVSARGEQTPRGKAGESRFWESCREVEGVRVPESKSSNKAGLVKSQELFLFIVCLGTHL